MTLHMLKALWPRSLSASRTLSRTLADRIFRSCCIIIFCAFAVL
jgi:hypothetical protein